MTTNNTETIRVIAYREDEMWVAQCLEYDISAQGHSFQACMRRLTATVNAESEYTLKRHGSEFATIDSAPQTYFDMFEAAMGESLRADNMEWKIAA